MKPRQRSKAPLDARLILCAFLLISFIACAAPQTYTIHLRYQPVPRETTKPSVTLGLTPFEDARSFPTRLGTRIRSDGTEESIVAGSPSPRLDLTRMMHQHLRSRGFHVMELPTWKPDAKGLEGLPAEIKVAIFGRIDALEVEAHSSLWRTSVRYRVRLTAHLGLKEKGEVLTRSIELSPKETYLTFDSTKIETQLNSALMEALERLVKGIPLVNNPN